MCFFFRFIFESELIYLGVHTSETFADIVAAHTSTSTHPPSTRTETLITPQMRQMYTS